MPIGRSFETPGWASVPAPAESDLPAASECCPRVHFLRTSPGGLGVGESCRVLVRPSRRPACRGGFPSVAGVHSHGPTERGGVKKSVPNPDGEPPGTGGGGGEPPVLRSVRGERRQPGGMSGGGRSRETVYTMLRSGDGAGKDYPPFPGTFPRAGQEPGGGGTRRSRCRIVARLRKRITHCATVLRNPSFCQILV